MKFSTRPRHEAQQGDVRYIRVFLFFPKVIDYEGRWLERARIKQRYIPTGMGAAFMHQSDGVSMRWADISWADKEC